MKLLKLKIFRSKKARLITLLSTVIATLSAALIISTVSWFSAMETIEPETNIPSSILTSYFDRRDGEIDESVYPHGSANNPYVITRPVHYYNLVRLHEGGEYGFDNNTYFEFGKQFGKPSSVPHGQQTTEYPYLFYDYNDNGVIQEGEYTPYLNMEYYSGSLALAPIGSARHPFEGHIIGHNLTVQNLHIDGSGYSDVGIFGYVASNAVVNELYFDSPSINAGGAVGDAPGSIGHAAHRSHVYVGYLAGHVYNPNVFYNVYLNNCVIYNDRNNTYEMINTYGYFGHTDEPLESTSDSSSYTSQLVASNAYDALAYTYSTGYSNPLARRYTSETSPGKTFSNAVSSSNEVYTIGQDGNSGTKPYSLSSIGYSSGDAGSSKYIRYYDPNDNAQHYKGIEHVEPENILTEKPVYIEYGVDENGDPTEPINHGNESRYDFYGMNDGSYIFYDATNEKWKYAEVVATNESSQGTVELNCFTISFEQTVNSVTKKYFLHYVAGANGAYDKMLPVEWTSSTPPQTDDYYFCFKTSFGSNGVSRFTECSGENDYYIYSPVGQKYLCTYSPQNVNSDEPYLAANLVHTPIFVPEEGIEVETNKRHMPMKFTIGGPKTQISYDAVDNKFTGNERNVNDDFDANAGRTAGPYKGALQGSNITNAAGAFGGHKMTAQCPGGFFTIGDYIEEQTTTLTDAINYKLTSYSSEIVDDSTLVIAGYKGEQTSTYSLDYAMGTQTQNNRAVLQVKEVRDTSGYVLNETTGVAKLIFDEVGTDPNDGKTIFTLYDGTGYLAFPKGDGVYEHGTNGSNWLRTFDYDTIYEEGHSNRIPYSQWKFDPYVQSGYYTRYRFQNVGDPDRYLCYNIRSNVFATYSLSSYLAKPEVVAAGATGFSNENVNNDYDGYPNVRCWFYIYKQQIGQTIQNVHFTISKTIEIQGTIHPFKTVTYYDLLGSDVENSPTDYAKYTNFTVNPSYNVYFNTTQSKVQYFDALIEVWKRVNIVSEIKSGDQVMIAAKTGSGNTPTHYFMGSQASNYRNRSSSVNFAPPYVKAQNVPSNAQRFTIVRTETGWRFDSGNGFLYACSSSQNYLRTEATPDTNGNANWSISILTDGTASIVSQGNYTHNKIQYYSRWNSGYFSCFTGNQTSIQLYKLAQSSADKATYVGDLINDFEPFRMDAVGPNIEYHSTYMKMNQSPSVISAPSNGDNFYPSVQFKNAITLLIDNNGSRDLGTLIFECTSTSTIPYFKLADGTTENLVEAGAVDTSPSNDRKSYLLNINAINIQSLAYACIKGVGDAVEPFKYCSADDPDMTKYLVVLGASPDVHIENVTFTFNAVPGNIGYGGKVDYRSASYDANTGAFTGSVAGGQQVDFSALSIYYDVTATGQKVGINVTFQGTTYTVTIDSTKTVLTEPLIINFFKYDNNATTLVVVVNGVSTTYYTGTISITIPANNTP